MKIYCDNIIKKFNSGLGILPTSIIVKINPHKPPVSLELFYDMIKVEGCIDLIIVGPINEESKQGLSWLTPKLISEGYFISYFTDINERLPNIIFTQYIFDAQYDSLRRRNDLKGLGNKAIIILREDNLSRLMAARQTLLKTEVNSKIMFDKGLLDEQILIDHKVYDLYPYVEIL